MSGKQTRSIWTHTSNTAFVAKSVVGLNGLIVGKNFEGPEDFQRGDATIMIRVETSISEPPDAQLEGMRTAAELAVDELYRHLGMKPENGFEPGVVALSSNGDKEVLGLIHKVYDNGTILMKVVRGGRLVLMQIPSTWSVLQVPDAQGVNDLALTMVKCEYTSKFDDKCGVASIIKDESALEAIALACGKFDDEDIFVINYPKTFSLALQKIGSIELLIGIANQTEHMAVIKAVAMYAFAGFPKNVLAKLLVTCATNQQLANLPSLECPPNTVIGEILPGIIAENEHHRILTESRNYVLLYSVLKAIHTTAGYIDALRSISRRKDELPSWVVYDTIGVTSLEESPEYRVVLDDIQGEFSDQIKKIVRANVSQK
ncbi:MAG: hypothetical protein ABIH21_05420 [Patescibacteria group bacterium]